MSKCRSTQSFAIRLKFSDQRDKFIGDLSVSDMSVVDVAAVSVGNLSVARFASPKERINSFESQWIQSTALKAENLISVSLSTID